MNLKPRLSRDGKIDPLTQGWRLAIPSGSSNHYRLAQLDDHLGLPRQAYPYHPPLTLYLRARISSPQVPGTWGFGLWNDPFGFSVGPGEGFLHLPALPNTIWFFHASRKNYLSFRDDKPGQGLLAQVFQSPRFDPVLFKAGLVFPFSRKRTRQFLSRVINEDSKIIEVNETEWHSYRLDWTAKSSSFWVDDTLILASPVSPATPLGLVIWIDNQYAAFMPDGALKWGMEMNPKSEWLDIKDVEIRTIGGDKT